MINDKIDVIECGERSVILLFHGWQNKIIEKIKRVNTFEVPKKGGTKDGRRLHGK